jgi:hypothetical protein
VNRQLNACGFSVETIAAEYETDAALAEAGQDMTEAAIAAQIDVRLRYALGEWNHLDATAIENLFALLQKTQR